jgi:hypothetical protein
VRIPARLSFLLLAWPAFAAAQVGHLPENSPFRDVSRRPRVTLFGGWYAAAEDEAGVFPKSAPLLGARVEVHIGGPADIFVRLGHVSTERRVIDPTRSADTRFLETRDVSLGFGELGLAFSLTGAKSWHKIVPTLNGGIGLVSDFRGVDPGGFKHGTTFAVSYGLGFRYVPPTSRLSFRADIGSYMYSLEYPVSYFTPAGDGTSVLTQVTKRSQWRNNWTLTLGLSYYLFK